MCVSLLPEIPTSDAPCRNILNSLQHHAAPQHLCKSLLTTPKTKSLCLSQKSKPGLTALQKPHQMNTGTNFKTRAVQFIVFLPCQLPSYVVPSLPLVSCSITSTMFPGRAASSCCLPRPLLPEHQGAPRGLS